MIWSLVFRAHSLFCHPLVHWHFHQHHRVLVLHLVPDHRVYPCPSLRLDFLSDRVLFCSGLRSDEFIANRIRDLLEVFSDTVNKFATLPTTGWWPIVESYFHLFT
jgi:hypothetical protein